MTVESKHANIVKAAKSLGINPRIDLDWMWIAEEAANCQLPDEWSELENATGEMAYYNPKTKLLVTYHPVMEKFKLMYEEQRKFNQTIELRLGNTKIKSRISQIINEVLNRAHKGFPPVTPELVEQLAIVLNIESTTSYALCLQLRNTLEELVETQYEVSILLRQPVDPVLFLNNCRKSVVRLCVTSKPDDLLMCQECEKRSAKVKCEQCKDFFCEDCFIKTHHTGKRANHTKMDVCQLACDVCDVEMAYTKSLDVKPGTGAVKFCDVCLVTKSVELSGHRMKTIADLKCYECEKDKATRLCEDCCDLFCIECFLELHRRGKRRVHMPLILDEDGQLVRAGVHVLPQVTQQMIARARQSAQGNAWVAFRDDKFNTFWYHFGDKTTTRQNPYAA